MSIYQFSRITKLLLRAAQLCFASAVLAQPLFAQCIPWTDSATTTGNLLIGKVSIEARNLFDDLAPNESRRIHRSANWLHIPTRESTIRSHVILKTGDRFTRDRLLENERILRSLRYIRDATVRPTTICHNAVNINIRTTDNWTLTPTLSFGSRGGVSKRSFGFKDSNVLGTGKHIGFAVSQTGEITEQTLQYTDHNFASGRYAIHIVNSSAEHESLSTVNLKNRQRTGTRGIDWKLDYFDSTTQHETPDLTGTASMEETSIRAEIFSGVRNSSANPYQLGLITGISTQSTETQSSLIDVDFEDFDHRHLELAVRWSQPDYRVLQHYRTMGVREDIDIGLHAYGALGVVVDGSDSSDHGVSLELEAGRAWLWDNNLLTINGGLRQISGTTTDRLNGSAAVDFTHWFNSKNRLRLHFDTSFQKSASPFLKFELGGENGLKGFANGTQRGDRRVRSLLEYRRMLPWVPMQLARLGWSVFHEAGRAWDSGQEETWLQNVGAGLVIAPTRSSSANLFRAELVAPLNPEKNSDTLLAFIGAEIKY